MRAVVVAVAEAAGYFPFVRGPSNRNRVAGRHPRAAYWREYSRRRYQSDPAFRERRRQAAHDHYHRGRAA